MRAIKFESIVTEKIAHLAKHDPDAIGELPKIINRLERRKQLTPVHWRDHQLSGPLQKMRSIVTGVTASGETCVMLYKPLAKRVVIGNIGPHDAVYAEEIEAVKDSARSRGKRRRHWSNQN